MPKPLNLKHKTFGMWRVVSESGRDKWGATMWKCKCRCGTIKNVKGVSLTNRTSISCGCERSAMLISRLTTHGMTGTPIYTAWRSMLNRCLNKNFPDFKNYKGRGIKVCRRWRKFQFFYSDMSDTFCPGLELDRKNNNGDYTPSNCQWITRKQQQRNKRTNHIVKIGGASKTIAEWGELTGIKPNTILTRIRRGWPKHRLLEIANS